MRTKILIALCCFALKAFTQTVVGVDTLVRSGPVSKRINLVILSDGYAASEMPQFIAKATLASNHLLNTAPYSYYKKYFNVYAIRCPAQQSGVSHAGTATDVQEPASPVISVTNNFNTRFDNYNIHRLIGCANSSAVYNVLASAFPNYDLAIVLGNSSEYGGSGGGFAVCSTHALSADIVVHEMGHSFAGLADEYWAGPQYTAEKPNMTAASNTTSVKWSSWLGINGVGIYPYGNVSPEDVWFKPHTNCRMQILTAPYCPVCQQAIIEKIHSLTNPIDNYFPANDQNFMFATGAQWFKTELVKPNPNTLKTTWEINSNVAAGNADSLLITDAMFTQGASNTVVFTAMDTTLLSKDTAHVHLHSYSVVWQIDFYPATGIKEIKPKLEFSVFPDPATDVITISYNLLESAEMAISVADASGRTVLSEKSRRSGAGPYTKTLDVSGLVMGSYILTIQLNDQIINKKIIITK